MILKKYVTVLLLFVMLSVHAQMSFPDIVTQTDDIAQNSKAALLTLVGNEKGELLFASGDADPVNKIPARTDDLFEIGSASKMFTAIAVLQLIENGKLSLNTTMDKIFKDKSLKNLANLKGKNYWNKITVEMLLNHTSGMIDYLNVYDDDEKAMKMFAVKGKKYTFKEIVKLAVEHGDMNFVPGSAFKYCNTGYILLGEIIRIRSGMPWREYIRKNVFEKAGLTDTYFGEEIPKSAEMRKMKGHYNTKPSFMPPSLAGSAGEIVSNLNDLKRFLLAWHNGKLYAKPETLQMQYTQGYHAMYPEQTDRLMYGYGVMRIDGFYGHGGQTFGFQSYVTYNPEKKQMCIFGTNDATAIPATMVFMSFEGISF